MSEKNFESSGSKTGTVFVQSEGPFNAGIILTESNYDIWSQLMEMHIAEREKLSYIHGRTKPPAESEAGYEKCPENGLDTSYDESSHDIETEPLSESFSLQPDTPNQSLVEDALELVPNSPKRHNPPRSTRGMSSNLSEKNADKQAKQKERELLEITLR
ncbi:hypothetical protein RHGRI_031501 [Rhododendron griersonianum]|uniref:Retrotransposon Copia-like N-terminal domain-containing protein n=1 Tax=Rhododendron griersonianum TaxID=479676 RepID=A0AAV6IB95_9ERIC|nr:hypothetical protein RHGRI_031501 [Rhododendron griersonianum]